MKIEKEIREILKYYSGLLTIKTLARKLTELFKSYARSLVPEEKSEKIALADHEIQTLTFEEKQKYYIEVEKRKVWNECREEMLRRIEEDRR